MITHYSTLLSALRRGTIPMSVFATLAVCSAFAKPQTEVAVNPLIDPAIWEAPAQEQKYFVRIDPSARRGDSFPADVIALRTALVSHGATIDAVLSGPDNIYLRLALPPQQLAARQALLHTIQALPLVSSVISSSAAHLVITDVAALTEYSPAESIPEAKLRGFHPKRHSQADASKPHTTRILVRLLEEHSYKASILATTLKALGTLHTQLGVTVVETMAGPGAPTLVIDVPSATAYQTALDAYNASSFVEIAEPDFISTISVTPNDPSFNPSPTATPNQWGMAKISAPSAWNTSTSSGSVAVAVMDTGINYNHVDLAGNLWPSANSGPSCGFNEVGGSTPLDDNAYEVINGQRVTNNHYHGTHVAGIIGSVGNNGIDFAGVCWSTKLMAVKVADDTGSIANMAAQNGFSDARNHGAGVINASFNQYNSGYTSFNPTYDSLDSANIVLVHSAGNNLQDIDTWTPDTADNYLSPSILYVGASDSNDNTSSAAGTDVGQYSVDLFAPGDVIWSDWGYDSTGSQVESMSGTSQAAPHVTGAVALLKNQFSWESGREIADRVRFSVDAVSALANKCWTGGRLNVSAALTGSRPRLSNISTRCYIGASGSATAGFVVTGSTPKTIAIRAQGPNLQNYGISNYLPDPKLTLYNQSGTVIDTNNDWGTLSSSSKQVLQNNGITPAYSVESALVETLAPGSYTVQIADVNGSAGVGIIEAFDTDGSSRNRFVNISTLATTSSSGSTLIGGFTVDDSGGNLPRTVFIHAYGPSLGAFGVSNPLQDPVLTVYHNGSVIATNQGWTNLPQALQYRIRHGGLAAVGTPGASADSAVVLRLAPGSYTATITSASGGSGSALVEVDEF